jgi:DnaJ domain
MVEFRYAFWGGRTMASVKDPKGYYARLGVTASANAADIKKAYRQLAKAIHPDISRDAGAKARFQEINEAYAVLSDPDLRNKYDALQYSNPEPQKREANPEPICCSRCGKITAQPRSTVFFRVVSLVLVTTRTPVQGIFCSLCARKAACKQASCPLFWGGGDFLGARFGQYPQFVRMRPAGDTRRT